MQTTPFYKSTPEEAKKLWQGAISGMLDAADSLGISGLSGEGYSVYSALHQAFFSEHKRAMRISEGTGFDPEVLCTILEATADGPVALMWLPEGACTDMSGAINYCLRRWPQVDTIITYSGKKLDTCYGLRGGEWAVMCSR